DELQPRILAMGLTMRARLRARIGRLDGSERDLRQALELAKKAGDVEAQILAWRFLSLVHLCRAEKDEALDAARKPLILAEDSRRTAVQGMAQLAVALVAVDLGDRAQAQRRYEQMLVLCQQANDVHGEIAALTGLSVVHSEGAQATLARRYGERALALDE